MLATAGHLSAVTPKRTGREFIFILFPKFHPIYFVNLPTLKTNQLSLSHSFVISF